MKKRLSTAAVTFAVTGGLLLGSAGAASAAHCTDRGGPGNSDFATHVKAGNGPGAHNEGDHKGWSSCNPNSANYAQ